MSPRKIRVYNKKNLGFSQYWISAPPPLIFVPLHPSLAAALGPLAYSSRIAQPPGLANRPNLTHWNKGGGGCPDFFVERLDLWDSLFFFVVIYFCDSQIFLNIQIFLLYIQIFFVNVWIFSETSSLL